MTVRRKKLNAHLIAAAPELREALAGLVHWLDRHEEGGGETPHGTSTMAKAYAAIAKAEGREP